jgi:uncharacterized protein
MSGGDHKVQVVDEPDHHRYELRVEGDLAGFLEYRRVADLTVLTHAEVDDAFGGRGLGSVLVRDALHLERDQGRQIEPRCPFVISYLRRHRADLDLVPDEHRYLVTDEPG